MNREQNYVRTKRGFTVRRWNSLKRRTELRDSYKNVELDMSYADFAMWIDSQWERIAELWKSGETPTIDRVDNKKAYSIHNIQILSVAQHNKKSAHEREFENHNANDFQFCIVCNQGYFRRITKQVRFESWVAYKRRKTCSRTCYALLKKENTKRVHRRKGTKDEQKDTKLHKNICREI